MEKTAAAAEIDAVTVKLPTFWKEQPQTKKKSKHKIRSWHCLVGRHNSGKRIRRSFTGFLLVETCFTGFYRVLSNHLEDNWVLPGFF